MKSIKYKVVVGQINNGTEESPNIEPIFQQMENLCSDADLEAVLSHVLTIAHNGEYTIKDVDSE